MPSAGLTERPSAPADTGGKHIQGAGLRDSLKTGRISFTKYFQKGQKHGQRQTGTEETQDSCTQSHHGCDWADGWPVRRIRAGSKHLTGGKLDRMWENVN